MASFTRNKTFKAWLVSKLEKSLTTLQSYPSISTNFKLSDSPHFTKQQSLKDIAASLSQLCEYKIRALRQNGIIYQRTNSVHPSDVEQLNEIGYFDKLVAVNKSIDVNYNTLSKITEYTLKKLITNNEFNSTIEAVLKDTGYTWDSENESLVHDSVNSIKFSKKSNQGRVNEAMCHIVRDWCTAYDLERKPLVDFMKKSLKNAEMDEDTLIIVPGSGCGRLAYELAVLYPKAQVSSIEYSSLMYLCNEYVLGANEKVTIDPYYQYYSGQQSKQTQTRHFEMDLGKFQKPENLKVLYGDFCCYNPEKKYKNVIVCSAFFIDTAANMFDYFKAIELLSKYSSGRLHWVNVGPLKYGTRPLVQLTFEELTNLRKVRGWNDHSNEVDVNHLNGYLTDYESLFQGFYGLVRFHSELKR
ncbi:unnamed protein product [Kluyveromyces dobzhanskii CBS 2104]|uniref:WGS project CCBQ000000000 data, contig 00099 n=1 Tax=Kluyveromyces dobzhanskii CBS 2104 TaxID=1427455 RepID=A0A0A8L4D4_9SACH|nr:unnamed protein product [Kluyveromyces dobzhanskii CBS 2104]